MENRTKITTVATADGLGYAGQIAAGEAWLKSVFVNGVTTSLTVAIYDALTETGTAKHSFVVAAATNYPMDNEHYSTGCYVSLTGTGSVTFRTLEQ